MMSLCLQIITSVSKDSGLQSGKLFIVSDERMRDGFCEELREHLPGTGTLS